jgi:hypothetical protein
MAIFTVDPDTLTHGNLPGKGDITVAICGMLMVYFFCFRKKHGNPLPSQWFYGGGAFPVLHVCDYLIGVILSVPGI